jgi:hypothetical protein
VNDEIVVCDHDSCLDRNAVMCFHLSSIKACSTYRFAAAGAARRKSASASLPCRRRGE